VSLAVEQSDAFEAVFESGETGLTGTLSVGVFNGGVPVIGPTIANISETGATGVYTWDAPAAPGVVGQYKIIWSPDASFSEDESFEEDLLVVATGTSPLPPPLPPITPGQGAQVGPCSAWTTAEEVAACCNVDVSSDDSIFDTAVTTASQTLFELQGRDYAGECSKTVYPPCSPCWCGFQVLSRGHIVGPWDVGWYGGAWDWLCDTCLLGCDPSTAKLSGFPVREITEVKIDGVVLAASEYRLDKRRYVTRLDNERWPIFNNWTLPNTESGTWTIAYTYGMDPPLLGRQAATQLACEVYKSCLGLECALPTGATRITRQGITIERQFFRIDPATKAWRTGLGLVDMFLNTYNPTGRIRKPVFWAPGQRHRYAQQLG
jgi:hypothetical protein